MRMFVGLVTVALAAVIVESRGVLPSTATVTNGAINSKISNEETILTAEDFENAKKLTLGQKYRKHDRKGMENPDLFEGDIANPELNSSTIYLFMGQANSTDLNGTMRNAIRNRNRRWPENVIPYTISTSYSTNERAVIADALNDMMKKTCFKFVGQTSQTAYVRIMRGNGCYSAIGRTGNAQVLSLGNGCVTKDIVQHEMIHAIGLFHEQSRADRDQYVEVLRQNILQGEEHNFEKYGLNFIDHLGQPYDYYSIMHYAGTLFAKRGTETLRPVASARAKGIKLERRRVMSAIDIKKLNIIGGCPNCARDRGNHASGCGEYDSIADCQVDIWRIKKLINCIENASGNGTSLITLVIPAKEQIARTAKMLSDELGAASCIKSRVNRLSVISALNSVLSRLKLYNKVPPNGLIIYCGTIAVEGNKEKKINIDFEPFRPIKQSVYQCDNRFHTNIVQELLVDDNKFGFIVMDGNGALFGTLQGNSRDVLHKFTVDLPKKHGRGGQSALRFARLRMEKRHNYVRKVAELAVEIFIKNDKANVSGLILAGSADFKTELGQSDMFDQRLQAKIIKTVDVAYGGENGFNQAIELAAEVLGDIKFVREKKLIQQYFSEIQQNTGKYVFGVEETLKALEMGAVETLICWENLEITRYVLKNHSTNDDKTLHLTPEGEKDKSHFIDQETGVELELVESMALLEWLANNYKGFGATLEIVTDKSQEGAQYVRGFGGIGGLLRYQVELQYFDLENQLDGIDINDY